MRNELIARRMPGRARGAGLLEVLIAVLVLSIALLGIISTQVKALALNNSAGGRSVAIMASYSIMEMMRADLAAATAGSYNTTVTANACPSAGGSLAASHLSAWCAQLGGGLGAAASTTGTISCNGGGTCTITETFDDSHPGVGPSGSPAGMTGSTSLTVTTTGIL